MQLPPLVLVQPDTASLRIRLRPEHVIDARATLSGFSDYCDFINLTRGMVARGFAGQAVNGIPGANFLRVFDAVCG